MARHRNVRTMDLDEEYDGYYSCYGHSVEDDFCISPQTEAQFVYRRHSQQMPMSNFLRSDTVEEEGSEDSVNNDSRPQSPIQLSPTDYAKLQSCIEAMQNVVGDTVSEQELSKAASKYNYDLEKALDNVLSGISLERSEIDNRKEHVANDKAKGTKNEVLICKLEEQGNDSPLSQEIIGNSKAPNEYETEIEVKYHSVLSTEKNNSPQLNTTPIHSPNVKQKTRTDVMQLYEMQRGSEKPLLNLVVVGHVDAGKSTLMGHLLFKLGCVSKKTMHKYEHESKKLGKASFMFAWVLDETSEERCRGITMDVAQSKFVTPNRRVNLLDAPGHKDFIPNMITGATQADVAILVVDSTRGEFETGFEMGGQTREHTMLIRTLGISQVVVVINKMDNVNWEKQRYDEIVKFLSVFLKQTGFKEGDIWFIPCSGLTGENLATNCTERQLKMWYSGPSLIDVIDTLNAPERPILKPLRMCIADVFKGTSGGLCVDGKIEAGVVQCGDKVSVMPLGEVSAVKSISINDMNEAYCFAGDHVVLHLTGIDINNVHCGNVVCDVYMPIKVTCHFQARLVIFNIAVPITKGFPVVLHYQCVSEQAVITKLLTQLHRNTSAVLKRRPRCLTKHSSADVEIELPRPICIELYRDFKELGRFMLRTGGTTIAAGLVTKIL